MWSLLKTSLLSFIPSSCSLRFINSLWPRQRSLLPLRESYPLRQAVALWVRQDSSEHNVDTRGLEARAENRDRNGARSCQRHRSLESAAPGWVWLQSWHSPAASLTPSHCRFLQLLGIVSKDSESLCHSIQIHSLEEGQEFSLGHMTSRDQGRKCLLWGRVSPATRTHTMGESLK